ncbi:hypothetical protein H7198_04160 [Fructobacillus sp. CRL 2054]|nr:hypothetical protein [Fructobacillus sp. CRL 2054]
MDFLTLIKEKKAINQAAIAVPMALGPNDKFTPFRGLLDTENPDAVIWQADAIADDFSKEVIWDQVKQGGAQAVDEGDMSAMKKAAMKAELDKAHEEFLSNWPSIQQQIIQELLQNAKQTANGRYLFLSYATKAEGGSGEMAAADQAFFLVSTLKAGGSDFAGVYIPSQLDENLQGKVREAAKTAGVLTIQTQVLADLTEATLTTAFEKAEAAGDDFLNLEISAAALGEYDVSDIEAILSDLSNKYADKVHLILTLTGQLNKETLEAWLILPSALVTLALSGNYQTPLIQSTMKELGWN